MKVERHVEPREQVSQLVRAAPLRLTHDVEQVKSQLLILGPARQELSHHPVQILLKHPRLGDVIVRLAEGHGFDDRAAGRVVTLDQQHALGQRVQPVRAGQELDSRQLGHLVVDDEQRDGRALVSQGTQGRESGCRRGLGDEAEVAAEPPAQVIAERARDPGVVIDHEDHGVRCLGHVRLSPPSWAKPPGLPGDRAQGMQVMRS